MDDQMNRKRRSGLLCSKKEIILSRSLGAGNTNERKSRLAVTEMEHKIHVASGERKGKVASDPIIPLAGSMAFFPYSEVDRRRDEDILKRFDQEIGFDDRKAIELSAIDAATKKRKFSKATPGKEFQDAFMESEQEVIDLASSSIDNINIALKSQETSSDFIVSKSSKTSPARRRVKNTIPSDTFERYLASIVKRYPPMTERDRVMFWKFTPEVNDDENGLAPVEPKCLRSSVPRKILENNNENPSSPTVGYKSNDSILFTINSNERLKSERFSTEDSKNKSLSPINCTQGKDSSIIIKSYSRREPLRVYGNARQIKLRSSNRGSLESGFKMPSNPDKSQNTASSVVNKVEMSTAQKEEFYKYLGLETTSPNGKSDYAQVQVTKKRRSLRVRQMQLQQKTNNRVKQINSTKPSNTNNNVSRESRKKQRLSQEIKILSVAEQLLRNNQAKENVENLENPLPFSKDRERSPSLVRRTCGSVVKSFCSERSESKSASFLQIIERIDYSKNTKESEAVIDMPQPYQPIYTETAKMDSRVDIKREFPKPIAKYNTRMTRKNGYKVVAKTEPVKNIDFTELDHHNSTKHQIVNCNETNINIDGSRSDKIPDIIELGRKLQVKHLQEKIPTVISCVEHIEYEKPVQLKEIAEKFSRVEAISNCKDSEDIPIKDNEPGDHSKADKQSIGQESKESDLLGFESFSHASEDQITLENCENDRRTANDQTAVVKPSCEMILRSKTHAKNSIPNARWSKSITQTSETEVTPRLVLHGNRKKPTKTSTISAISDKNSSRSFSTNSRASVTKLSPCNHSVDEQPFFELSTSAKAYEDFSTEHQKITINTESCEKTPEKSHLKIPLRKRSLNKSKYKRWLKALKIKLSKEIRRREIIRVKARRVKRLQLKKQSDELNSTQIVCAAEGLPEDDMTSLKSTEDPVITDLIEDPITNGVSDEIIEDGETARTKIYVPNALPNPLQKTAGIVLHGFYEAELLIIVQERKVSFWKYLKVIRMFGQPQEWLFLGEHDRLLNDIEISSPYKNRLCITDSNPFYVEMRAKQFPDDPFRTCNMASVYVNVYYHNDAKSAVVLHSVNLDTIRGVYIDIVYTTLTSSRDLVMCWKQENITNTIHTGICKYSLTAELNQLAGITEFKTMSYVISNLDCLGDDKLIAIGGTRIAIWEHVTGDLLADFNVMTAFGDNLGSLYCPVADYLFLYQQDVNETTKCPQLIIMAVNLSENPLEFKIIQKHDLPQDFVNIKSSLSTDELIIVTSNKLSELLLLVQQPHRLFYSNMCGEESNTERFYSTGSQYFVEITEESLIVKTIHEFLLDFVK